MTKSPSCRSSPQPARCLQDEEGRCYSDSFLELPSRLPEEEEEAAVRQMVDGDKMEAEEEEKPALKWVPLPAGGASSTPSGGSLPRSVVPHSGPCCVDLLSHDIHEIVCKRGLHSVSK